MATPTITIENLKSEGTHVAIPFPEFESSPEHFLPVVLQPMLGELQDGTFSFLLDICLKQL